MLTMVELQSHFDSLTLQTPVTASTVSGSGSTDVGLLRSSPLFCGSELGVSEDFAAVNVTGRVVVFSINSQSPAAAVSVKNTPVEACVIRLLLHKSDHVVVLWLLLCNSSSTSVSLSISAEYLSVFPLIIPTG